MKTTFFLLLILCIGVNTNAQETFEITYKSGRVPEGTSLFTAAKSLDKSRIDWYTIISHDTTFTFGTSGKREKKKHLKNGLYAKKPIHHSMYYESKNHSKYETVAFKGDYFICSEDKPNPKNYWMDTIKTILNYECQAAMIFSKDGDSSTMWIARNLKPGLVTYHHGYVVPGIAMETLDLKYALYYKAVKVEKTGNQIYFPNDYPQVSREEFQKKKVKENSTTTN